MSNRILGILVSVLLSLVACAVNATEDPHLASVGIEKVWVNGQLVFNDGKVTGIRPGKVIRRPATQTVN